MKKVKHWLAHLLAVNVCQVISGYDTRGRLWIGFKCAECGKISGAHVVGK